MTTVTKEDVELLLSLFSKKGQYDARTGEQVCCLQSFGFIFVLSAGHLKGLQW